MERRPKPPPGFVRFEWEHEVKDADQPSQHRARICPECGEAKGFVGGNGGWQDDEVQKVVDAYKEADDTPFFKWKMPDGTDIKSHWSRWGVMECMNCGCRIWHDFINSWHYYYKPKKQSVLGNFY